MLNIAKSLVHNVVTQVSNIQHRYKQKSLKFLWTYKRCWCWLSFQQIDGILTLIGFALVYKLDIFCDPLVLNYFFNEIDFCNFACMLRELDVKKVILDYNQRDFISSHKWQKHCFQLVNLIQVELLAFIIVKGILQIKVSIVSLECNNYSYIYRINFKS